MSKGVFTRMKRVTFVKGWLTGGTPVDGSVECGDGTAYPLEVTLDQLAEILYRVKRFQVTAGGSATATYPEEDDDDYIVSYTGPSVEPNYSHKGYQARLHIDDPFVVPASHAMYFGDEYVVEDPYDSWRQWNLLNDERGLWLPELPTGHTYYSEGFFPGFSGITTGLTFSSYDSNAWLLETNNIPDETGPAGASLYFSSSVAFVDTTGSGSIYDPQNKIYFGSGFSVFILDGAADFNLSSTPDDPVAQSGTIQLNIVLSTSTVSMKLYWNTGSGSSSFSGSDIEISVTEWWPYAKDSPAVPVWDADTGLKL